MSGITLDQWRLFVQIADHGSLTDTATARDVAQSAISRQLAAIERQCGGQLFERGARGVQLNDVGQRLYPRVKEWLRSSEELVDDARGVLREPAGAVRLGIIESLATDLVGPLAKTLQRRYPGVRLRIVNGLSGRLTEALQEGQLDVALYSENSRNRQDRGVGLGTMPHMLVSAPGDALTKGKTVAFDSLDKLPLVIPGRPYAFHEVLEHWARRRGIKLQVALECDSLTLQKQLVATSGLYAIMAASGVRQDVAAGRLQAARIVNPTLDRRVVLRMSQERAASQATRVVCEVLRELSRSKLPSLIAG